VNVRVVVGAVRVPPPTVTLTLMVAGLPPAPGEVTVTVPAYVPGAVSLVLSTVRVRDGLVLVLPVAGLTPSQFPALEATALYVSAVLLDPIVTV